MHELTGDELINRADSIIDDLESRLERAERKAVVFDEMLAALQGAQVTIESWCPDGRDVGNSDNYCRVVDVIRQAEALRKL